MESSTTQAPKMRADAQRNRAKLLDSALALFSEHGSDVPLEAIAREAGLGVGTLYRHFPDRDALVAAVYLNELDRLHDGAAELLAEYPADEALTRWMDLFVDYAMAKRGLKGALQAMVASGAANPFADAKAKMLAALTSLVEAAREAGAIRSDIEADDIMRAISGIWAMPADEPEWDARARTQLRLLMDGLRYGA